MRGLLGLNRVLEIKFFLRGDENGEMHNMTFDSYYKANTWKKEMGASAEIFSEKIVWEATI